MKATLGQRPAAIVGTWRINSLVLLPEAAKFRGEAYWQRAVRGLKPAALHALPVLWTNRVF